MEKEQIIKIVNLDSENHIYIYSLHKELIICEDINDYKKPIGYKAEMSIGYDSILKKVTNYSQSYKNLDDFVETEFLNNAINYKTKIHEVFYESNSNKDYNIFLYIVLAIIFILIGFNLK